MIQTAINQDIFEQEADSYQLEFFEKTLGARYVDRIEKQIVLDLVKSLNSTTELKILDIGAGGGRWSELMLKKFPNAQIQAVDFATHMVENLNKKLRSKRFLAKVGDVQALPFENNSFDLVVAIRCLKYSPNQKLVLSEISRVLRPGSLAVLEFPYPNIVYKIIQKLGFFGKLNAYSNRIVLNSKAVIEENIQEQNLKILASEIHFSVPATVYKNVDNSLNLKIINFINQVLPKRILGRSLFVLLTK